MQSEIVGQVTDVQGRQVSSGTIFDVTINGQKVSTFKGPVAQKANDLKGQIGKATVDIVPWQKGEKSGQNYTLLDIVAVGAFTPAPVEGPENGLQRVTGPIPAAPTNDARQESIEKQSARNTAFNYAAQAGLSVDEAFGLANELYFWEPTAPKTLDDAIQQQGLAAAVEPATVTEDFPW